MPQFAAVRPSDFDAMLAVRIEALRESLERLGRFDPQRARERLAAGFAPQHMQHIEVDGQRVGFMTLRPDQDAVTPTMKLDHLYVRPGAQGQGIGAWALECAKAQAVAAQCDIALSALKLSAANRFYLRHGFVAVGETEFDVDYRWAVQPRSAA
jgi:GNAT superfamily N-acetyltransferase